MFDREGPVQKSSDVSLKIVAAPKSVKQMVYESLRMSIIENILKPGQELAEESLAAQFGVSRTPIREAFLELAREGLVRLEPRRGAYVTEISPRRVKEMYEMREVLERFVIERAAIVIPDSVLASLRATYDRVQKEVAAGEYAGFHEFDRHFHELLAHYADNSLIEETLMRLYDQVLRIRIYFGENHNHMVASCAEHGAILQALEAHDPHAAAEAISHHDRCVSQRVLDLLQHSMT
jgi:DNA-binding GntR family transcriptional regulator